MPNYLINISNLGDLLKALAAVAGYHNAESLAAAMSTRRSGGISKSAVERWFKNENKPDQTHRHKIIKFFESNNVFRADTSDELFVHFIILLNSDNKSDYLHDLRSSLPGVLSSDTLHKIGWTVSDAVERMFKLDWEEYDGITVDNEGTPEQWIPAFEQYPDTWRVLVLKGELIGYWQSCVFLPNFYEKVKDGQLMEGLIEPLKVYEIVDLPGIYSIYILSMVLSKNYRNPVSRRMLINSFFSVLNDFAARDVYFKEVTTNSYSHEGLQMCESFGMQYQKDHHHSGMIYTGSIKVFLNRYKIVIDKFFPALISRCKSAGLY